MYPFIRTNKPFVGTRVFYSGFSLIELLIAVTILGILAGLAVPSINQFIESNRLSASANDLVADINLARSEAIKHNAQTGLCAASGSTCATSTNWGSAGWLVMRDSDNNGSLDMVVKRHDPSSSSTTTITAAANTLNFSRQGMVGSAAWGSITVCNSKVKKTRLINVEATGRVKITEGTC
jgi:type IV fimbrial biogenesis protein FimT